MMLVCLFVCVGGSVGDGDQDGSSTKDSRKRSKSKVTIHFDDKVYTVKKLHNMQFFTILLLATLAQKVFFGENVF